MLFLIHYEDFYNNKINKNNLKNCILKETFSKKRNCIHVPFDNVEFVSFVSARNVEVKLKRKEQKRF